MICIDTGPLVAFFDASDQYHKQCSETLESISEPLITTWPVVTEAFLILDFSWKAQAALWQFVLRGGLEIRNISEKALMRCRTLMEKYRDLPMDLADATLVALGEELKLHRIFTLDRKHFQIYRPLHIKGFDFLPPVSIRPGKKNEGVTMAYDRQIEQMIGSISGTESGLTAKPMFGGVCYLIGGNMAFGIYRDNLIIRLGSPERAQEEIDSGRALPFDITGKAMKGWVMIPKAGLKTLRDYRKWLNLGLGFARSLPPKK